MVVYLVYQACERNVYFVAVEASYAESAFSLMYCTYSRVLTRVRIVRSTGKNMREYDRETILTHYYVNNFRHRYDLVLRVLVENQDYRRKEHAL